MLRAGFTDYVVNAEALAYMRQRALAGPVIARLAEHPERHFADEAAWRRHLERLGIAGADGHARSGHGSRPKARSGAASRRTGCCPTR